MTRAIPFLSLLLLLCAGCGTMDSEFFTSRKEVSEPLPAPIPMETVAFEVFPTNIHDSAQASAPPPISITNRLVWTYRSDLNDIAQFTIWGNSDVLKVRTTALMTLPGTNRTALVASTAPQMYYALSVSKR